VAIFLETAQGRQEIDAATLMGGIGGDLIGAGGDDDLRKKIDAKLKETRQGRLPFFNPQAGMTKAEAAKSGFEQAIKTVEDVVGATSKAGLIIEGAKALNDIFKVVPLGKGDESIGQVPNQIEHDSSRIRIEASPRNILRLALPRAFTQEKGANVPFLRKVIRGEATNEKGTSTIAPPWLKLKWDEEVKKWRVSGHEGRTRSIASLLERGDDPIPIDLFLKNKVGNRITEDRVTPEMRKALTLDQVIPQGRRTKRALPKDPVTIGQTFNAPEEKEPPTIDEAFGEKPKMVEMAHSAEGLADLTSISEEGLRPDTSVEPAADEAFAAGTFRLIFDADPQTLGKSVARGFAKDMPFTQTQEIIPANTIKRIEVDVGNLPAAPLSEDAAEAKFNAVIKKIKRLTPLFDEENQKEWDLLFTEGRTVHSADPRIKPLAQQLQRVMNEQDQTFGDAAPDIHEGNYRTVLKKLFGDKIKISVITQKEEE